MAKGHKPGKKSARHRQLDWGRRVLAGLVFLTLVVGGLAWWRVSRAIERRAIPVAVSARASDEPTNILLVGSDSRAGLSKLELARLATEPTRSKLTDTIVVLQLSRERRPVIVSIPRDLRVKGTGGDQKINAMSTLGGPNLLVRTVEQVTGLPIHHYVEIDFAGFLDVVDDVGGVRLCNDSGTRMVDPKANLRMAAGCHEVNGAQALAFVRSRAGPTGDFGRIERQQQFMRALVDKVTAPSSLVDMRKTVRLTDEIADNLQLDDSLGTFEAMRMVWGIARAGDDIEMRVLPSRPVPPACDDCPAFVERLPEAALLMAALRRGDPELPPVGRFGVVNASLGSIRLEVLNGGGQPGAATDVARELRAAGIPVAHVADAPLPTGTSTTLTYPAGRQEQAELLRSLLGPDVELVKGGPAGLLVLTVGSEYQGLGSTD